MRDNQLVCRNDQTKQGVTSRSIDTVPLNRHGDGGPRRVPGLLPKLTET